MLLRVTWTHAPGSSRVCCCPPLPRPPWCCCPLALPGVVATSRVCQFHAYEHHPMPIAGCNRPALQPQRFSRARRWTRRRHTSSVSPKSLPPWRPVRGRTARSQAKQSRGRWANWSSIADLLCTWVHDRSGRWVIADLMCAGVYRRSGRWARRCCGSWLAGDAGGPAKA